MKAMLCRAARHTKLQKLIFLPHGLLQPKLYQRSLTSLQKEVNADLVLEVTIIFA